MRALTATRRSREDTRTMKTTVTGLLTLVPLLAWAPVVSAQLEPAGVVTTLLGTASVARASLPQPAPLKFKDQVFVKDRITTGENSVARILLGGKAVVTVRERSVLMITELPGKSIVEVGSGKAALAVVKERMKPGESIEIHTPNAVAAIRGTVVLTEVEQVSAQAGTAAPVAVVTRFIGVTGSFDVSQLVGGQRVGTFNVTASQSVQLAGAAPPRVQTLTRDAVQRLTRAYRINVPPAAPAAASASVKADHVQQATARADAVTGRQSGRDVPGPGSRDRQAGQGREQSGSGKAVTVPVVSNPVRPPTAYKPEQNTPGPSIKQGKIHGGDIPDLAGGGSSNKGGSGSKGDNSGGSGNGNSGSSSSSSTSSSSTSTSSTSTSSTSSSSKECRGRGSKAC